MIKIINHDYAAEPMPEQSNAIQLEDLWLQLNAEYSPQQLSSTTL